MSTRFRRSAELSEAINSMFQYYKDAEVCYAYLADVDSSSSLPVKELCSATGPSYWFSRGWTLQELIASSNLVFYASDWSRIATKATVSIAVSGITNIDPIYLLGPSKSSEIGRLLERASIAERMSWASKRHTSRIEDTAYCLLGIFGINMPLLYGEGANAFTRLQEEIARHSDDQSLFAWNVESKDLRSILATSPADFAKSKDVVPCKSGHRDTGFSFTNKGLEITLPMFEGHALLECRLRNDPTSLIVVQLKHVRGDEYQRVPSLRTGLVDQRAWYQWKRKTISITQRPDSYDNFPELPRFTVHALDGPTLPYSIVSQIAGIEIHKLPFAQTDGEVETGQGAGLPTWVYVCIPIILGYCMIQKWPYITEMGVVLFFWMRTQRKARESISEAVSKSFHHLILVPGMPPVRLVVTITKNPLTRFHHHVELSRNVEGPTEEEGRDFLTFSDKKNMLFATSFIRQIYGQSVLVVEVTETSSLRKLSAIKLKKYMQKKAPAIPEYTTYTFAIFLWGLFFFASLYLASWLPSPYWGLVLIFKNLRTFLFPSEWTQDPVGTIMSRVLSRRFLGFAYVTFNVYRRLWYQISYSPRYISDDDNADRGDSGETLALAQLFCVPFTGYLFFTDFPLFVAVAVVNVPVLVFVMLRNYWLMNEVFR